MRASVSVSPNAMCRRSPNGRLLSYIIRGRPAARRQRCAATSPSAEAVSHLAMQPLIPSMERRALLSALSACILALEQAVPHQALAEGGITIESETEGFGTHPARDGDLVLVHYTGTLEATGQVFDSTKGGLAYRDGGMGVFRPAVVRLGSGPVPGLCRGLRMAFDGMRVGGKRTVSVPAELGFGSATVGAPYAVVPPNSALRYEVELIRLSARGPDELTQGLSKCGAGGAGATAEGCDEISPAEFI